MSDITIASSSSSSSSSKKMRRKRVKVVIIGAGASGCMCAYKLLQQLEVENGLGFTRKEDIIILEARDRVGGRIHTTTEQVTSSTTNTTTSSSSSSSPSSSSSSSLLYRDHGAAWVHGTGFDWPHYHNNKSANTTITGTEKSHSYENISKGKEEGDDENTTMTPIRNCSIKSNPMMELLQQITPDGENVCFNHLIPTFEFGNPWTRPGHVLVKQKKLVLFVNGQQIGGSSSSSSSSSIDDSNTSDKAAAAADDDDQPNALLLKALDLHHNIMNQVGRIGYDMIVAGKTNETVQQSFQNALDQVLLLQQQQQRKQQSSSEENNKKGKDSSTIIINNTTDNSSSSSNNNIDDNQPNQELLMILSRRIAAFYRHLIEAWHATSASGLQLYEFSAHIESDDDEAGGVRDEQWTDEGDYYGPHCTMKRGMETILEPLLEKVSSCIQLNEPVVRCRCLANQSNKGDNNDGGTTISVETESGMIVDADYCVVTVSLGCLAHSLSNSSDDDKKEEEEQEEEKEEVAMSQAAGRIVFSPGLSSEKVNAIQRMCMGSYKKVFLSFNHIFWPINEPFLGLVRGTTTTTTTTTTKPTSAPDDQEADDGLGNMMLLDNLWACWGIPSIEAVLIGDAGKWATGKPDDAIRDAVLRFLADAMGLNLEDQLKPWCVDCHITRWEEDPYSRGAYSGYRLGTLEEHTAGLAASEWGGHLQFAGEATLSGYEGSVHAALISGVKVANEIIKAGMRARDNDAY